MNKESGSSHRCRLPLTKFSWQSDLLRRIKFGLRVTIFSCVSTLALIAGAATISTDQKDYWLGSTAIITGSGFSAGENIQVQVSHDDGRVDTNADHDPWLVTADGKGAFTTSWCVCDTDNEGSRLI